MQNSNENGTDLFAATCRRYFIRSKSPAVGHIRAEEISSEHCQYTMTDKVLTATKKHVAGH